MKTLTIGEFVVLLDDEDFPRIENFTVEVSDYKGDKKFKVYLKSDEKTVYLHRFLMDVWDKSTVVFHRNSNYLDNRKENLYTATSYAKRKAIDKRYGVEGACIRYDDKFSTWDAYYFPSKSTRKILGSYTTRGEAIAAHNAYIKANLDPGTPTLKLY